MKTNHILPTLEMLILASIAFALHCINCQAIINDVTGDALVDAAVTVQFTVLENGGTAVNQKIHNQTADANGIISCKPCLWL